MAYEYEDAAPDRCKAAVTEKGWHYYQCSRKPWEDGWCKQHHPETRRARRARADAKAAAALRNGVYARLARASARIRTLEDFIRENGLIPPERE